MNEHLKNALAHLWESKPLVLGQNEYDEVKTRVAAFRRNFPLESWRIRTSITFDGDYVRCHAKIQHRLPVEAMEMEGQGYVSSSWQTIAEGHAEEKRGGFPGDKPRVKDMLSRSVVEVAETSATGRALAFLGLSGGEICSAEELGLVEEHSDEFLELDKLETREEMREAYKALTKEARDRLSPEEIKQLNAKFED